MTDRRATSTTWPLRVAAELLPAAALLGFLLWDVRTVLTPFIVFPLLLYILWPAREGATGRRAVTALAVAFAFWLLAEVFGVLTPFVLAFAVAYLLAPAVGALERRKLPRPAAIVIVMLTFVGAGAGLLVLLIPALERQLLDVAARLPDLAHRTVDLVLALRTRFLASGARFLSDEQIARLQNLSASDLVQMVSGKWETIGERLWTTALGVGRGVGAGLAVLLTVLGYVIVAPIVTFYLLFAWPTLLVHIESLIPPAWRPGVVGFLKEYDQSLSRFVRRQLLESSLVAVATGGALAVLGFPGAVLMGVVAGLSNLIPVVGLFIGLVPGILIALTAPDIGAALLKLGGVYAVVQIMDGQITGPRIVGGSVGLHPVWMMVSVLVFGSLLGFVGMFLAVPLAALVKMTVVRLVPVYQRSAVYAAAE